MEEDRIRRKRFESASVDGSLWFRRALQPTAEFVVCFPLFGSRVYLGGTKKGELVHKISILKQIDSCEFSSIYSKERDVLTQASVKVTDLDGKQHSFEVPQHLFVKKEDLEKKKADEKELRDAEKSSVVILASQVPFGGAAAGAAALTGSFGGREVSL